MSNSMQFQPRKTHFDWSRNIATAMYGVTRNLIVAWKPWQSWISVQFELYNKIIFRYIHAFLYEQFYKNNEAQIWPKIKNNVRTIQAGIWNHKMQSLLFVIKLFYFWVISYCCCSYEYF